MVYELSEKYIPENFLFREKQQKEIESTFDFYKKFKICSNKLIIGSTGSGKTALLTKITSRYTDSVFVSARLYNTPNKILKYILNYNKKVDTSNLIKELNKKLKKEPKVIIIDEIDKCSNVSEIGKIMDTIFRESNIPFIIISSNWNILNKFPDDAQKTLVFSRVEFHTYSSIELKEILCSRLEIIKKKYPTLPMFKFTGDDLDNDGAIDFLSSKIYKLFNGSVRMLFNIASSCIVNNKFSKEFIMEEIQKKNKDEWVGSITKLSQTEKEFLSILLNFYDEKRDILTSEINEQMSDISSSRISQITQSLFNMGLINIKSVSSGKVGNKFRSVSFSSDEVKNTVDKVMRPWEYYNEEKENTKNTERVIANAGEKLI